MLIFLLLLVMAGFFLARNGRLGAPPWAVGHRSAPEFEARKILSERFANSEIGSDEFLERASVLNWTPGVEPVVRPRGRRRG